jgi:hypothetical protein
MQNSTRIYTFNSNKWFLVVLVLIPTIILCCDRGPYPLLSKLQVLVLVLRDPTGIIARIAAETGLADLYFRPMFNK